MKPLSASRLQALSMLDAERSEHGAWDAYFALAAGSLPANGQDG
jgi:hypothetical protein